MDGLFSAIDDSLVLFFGVHLLSGIRALVAFVALLVCVLVYLLIGITPAVPKRWFVPITLFFPVMQLLLVPVLIYAHGRMQEAEWAISLCELGIGLTVLFATRRKPLLKWPLIKEEWLKGRGLSWINLVGFILINCGLLIPLAILYLFFCGSLAVGHFSDGFVKLDTRGLTVQLRDYVRSDGKSIKLVPMSHVGDAGFYRELTQSFPSNSVVLLEGVSDEKNLLTNKITYKRMASSLGLAEQQKEFRPIGPKRVPADCGCGAVCGQDRSMY